MTFPDTPFWRLVALYEKHGFSRSVAMSAADWDLAQEPIVLPPRDMQAEHPGCLPPSYTQCERTGLHSLWGSPEFFDAIEAKIETCHGHPGWLFCEPRADR